MIRLWCVVRCIGRHFHHTFYSFSFSLSVPLCTPRKTHRKKKRNWHTHRDGTKPSLQRRTDPQRGRSLQCLLVFLPADPHGYRHSPTQDSHRETGGKNRNGESESDREHIFWSESWPNISSSSSSHLHPTAAYVVFIWIKEGEGEEKKLQQSLKS